MRETGIKYELSGFPGRISHIRAKKMEEPIKRKLWIELYELAEEYFSIKPWTYMEEVDVFGIRCPDSGNDYYMSVMGSQGQSFSLAAYEGTYALDKFWDIQNSEGELSPYYLLRIPHMLISLDEPEIINPVQFEMYKTISAEMNKTVFSGSSGKSKIPEQRDKMPHFTRIIPGLYPVTPDDEKLHDLKYILIQTIQVVKRAADNKAFIHGTDDDENDYFFRISRRVGDLSIWEDAKFTVEFPKIKIEVTYNTATLDKFISLPKSRDVMELAMHLLPKPVKEGDNPAYFPIALLMVNARNGKVLFHELIPPLPDFQSILGTLPEIIMKKCIDYGMKPFRIKFRNPDLAMTCNFLKVKAGVYVWHSFDMEHSDRAFESLLEYLDNKDYSEY